MADSPSANLVVMYHVVHERWSPGQPLKPWNMLVKEGVFEDSDWAHDRVRVGHDGDRVSLCEDLETAKFWRQKRPERILRITFPPGKAELYENSECFLCYHGVIPAEWIEVVDEGPGLRAEG